MRKLIFILHILLCSNFVFGQFGMENDISKSSANTWNSLFYDLDADGDLDILANSIGKIIWYENDGFGNYGQQRIAVKFTDYYYLGFVRAMDMDNDGDLDILFTIGTSSSSSTIVRWIENNGSGYFGGGSEIFSVNDGLMFFEVEDVDNDGDMDYIYGESITCKMSCRLNTGIGLVGTEQVLTTAPGSPYNCAFGDMDGDGDNDIITSANHGVHWYESLGGTFGPPTVLSSYSFPASNWRFVSCADFDNDGDLDVVITAETDGLFWLENDGSQNFSGHSLISGFGNNINPRDVTVGDVDGDSYIDILLLSRVDDVSWFKNNNGVFACCGLGEITLAITGDYNYSLETGDIDNDGDEDVITTTQDFDWINIYESFGNGNVSQPRLISEFTNEIEDFYVADFNGDGRNDIVSASFQDGRISYFENIGNGVMSPQIIISDTMFGANGIHAADIDGDGDLDILASAKNTHKAVWYENFGGGTFSPEKVVSNNVNQAADVYPADMDNDGDMDVIVLFNNISNSNDKVSWFENLGAGIFNPVENVVISFGTWGSISAIDTDWDGFLDAVYDEHGVYATDIDNDSDLDYMNLTDFGWGGRIDMLENTGASFPNAFSSDNVRYPRGQFATDITGDGLKDIILASDTIANGREAILWYENFGSNSFSSKRTIITGNKANNTPAQVFAADMDGDGDKDVIHSNRFYHKIAWFENFGLSPFQFTGKVYYDVNLNKIKDANEPNLPFFGLDLAPTGQSYYTDSTGSYIFAPDSGTYTVSYLPQINWVLTTDSANYTRKLTGINPIESGLDFGFAPTSIVTSLVPSLVSAFPRCNDIVNYWVNVFNEGTSIPSGVISLELDDSVSFISSNIIPDSIVGQTYYWSYDSLFFHTNYGINLNVQMPPFTSMGDTLKSYLWVYQLDTAGNIIYSSADTLKQVSVCAYDPNDKQVTPKGFGLSGFIANDIPYLDYLVRFQNTGTDTAISVMIRDMLDSNLNWNTLQVIASSDPLTYWVEPDGECVFDFQNILLPDSGVDFLGSQGYVRFRIELDTGLAPGTRINNEAHIYFDSNPPVITNNVFNTIFDCSKTMIEVINPTTCFGENVMAFTPEKGIIDYSWELDGFHQDSLSTLNWKADTVGTFNLTMTLTNSFCVKDTTVLITILPAIPVTTSSQSICSGDSVLIYGIPQYTAGIYNDTLQSILGCDSILSTSLSVNTIYYFSNSVAICQGDSISIFGSYLNSEGMYYDSLSTIFGCDSVYSTYLNINPLPIVNIVDFNPDTLCDTGTPVVLPTGAPSGGNYSGNGVGGGNYDPAVAGIGTHQVIYTYTDTNSCSNSDTTVVTVEICTGVDNAVNDFGILIYPNPNTGQFTIEKPNGLQEAVQVKLLDATSKLIIDKVIPIGKQKLEMDITNYSDGIYYLQLIVGDEVFVKQILKD